MNVEFREYSIRGVFYPGKRAEDVYLLKNPPQVS